MEWYEMSGERVVEKLKSDKNRGLSEAVCRTLSTQGKNVIEDRKKKSVFRKFFEQFSDFMVIILLIAAAISFVTALVEKSGEYLDPIIILGIVILNAIMGVVQEGRAQKAIEALKKMTAPKALVIRDGIEKRIDAKDLVVGDIILISAGDMIPADARLIESVGLKTLESALTGESLPVNKSAEITVSKKATVGDRKNMIFSSTVAVEGSAKAVVTSIGMNTEVGSIAGLLESQETPLTPLQIRLEKVGKILGFVCLGICIIIFAMGVLRSQGLLSSFMLAVSLAVAAIPEGLPAVVTVVLSLGVQRMAKRNAIIRRLPAVETLGAATVICSDKTGTLTENKMAVTKIYPQTKKAEIIKYAALCTNSKATKLKGKIRVDGEPTENAIVYALYEMGENKAELEKIYPRCREIPFDSNRKMMTTIHKTSDGYLKITKGAPDVLIRRCNMSESEKFSALKENEKMAKEALRVLAVAVKKISSPDEKAEENLSFCGLIGMLDPPRKEAIKAVKLCKEAGIKPVMITGDHALTAKAIAEKMNISSSGDIVVTGEELDRMTDSELVEKAPSCSVFARVSPEHKVRVVKAYQNLGEVVAMTGDGVNDAPALKSADIGCAMGKGGTDVAKNAADMVLTDDNFATIVNAVKEGRGIYDNIKKAIHFLLSSNVGEILVIFLASIFSLPTPVLPIQLLWINLVTDSLPAMALGVEKNDKEIMKRKPLKKSQGLFSNGLALDIALEGIMLGGLALLSFVIGMKYSLSVARTMAFCSLSLGELFHAFNMRSDKSLFKIGFFSNAKFTFAILACAVLQILTVTVGFLSKIFDTVMLTPQQWLITALLSTAPIIIVEIAKLFRKGEVYT